MEYAHLFGPGPTFKQILSGYRDFIDGLFSKLGVDWIVEYLLVNLPIWFTWFPKLHLLPHWKYVFLPLWIFSIRDGFICFQRNRLLGAVNWLAGLIIFVSASVAAGTATLDDPLMLAAVWPIAGFTLFNLFTAWLDSTFRRPVDQTWKETFIYYFVCFPLPAAAVGAALLISGARYELDSIAILLAFFLAMAIRNILVSMVAATKDRNKEKKAREKTIANGTEAPLVKTWWEHFETKQTKRLGLALLASVGWALVAIAIDKRDEFLRDLLAVAGWSVIPGLFALAVLVTLLIFLYRRRRQVAAIT
jgi:hypothetical protein